MANETALPFIVAPSGRFDGDDGQWATFAIEIGSPPQSFRNLPATVGSDILIPVVEGCQGPLANVSDCGDLRGADTFQGRPSRGFDRGASTSWSELPGDPYMLLDGQSLFGDSVSGFYGLDNVALGDKANASYSRVLGDQLLAGVAQENFWIGTIGLGSASSKLGSTSSPSLLSSLRNQTLIPSISFGYTAGQSYAVPPLPGSLVLGGYDETRLSSDPPPVTLPIESRASPQVLQLGLQSITASGALGGSSQQLLAGPITANIDSSVSQLWLPPKVCDYFAQAFGLTYSGGESNYYLLNDTIHQQLTASNPTLTFAVGTVNGVTVNVQLPYKAFDHNLSYPLAATLTQYFPLRQAQNESQYTLGRVFLQEAYIVVNWDNATLTVGQAVAQSSITSVQPILPPSQTASASGVASISTAPSHHKGIGTGAIAGIVVTIIALVLAAAGLGFFCMRRRRRAAKARSHLDVVGAGALEVHTGSAKEYYLPEKATNPKLGSGPHVEVNEVCNGDRPGLHERKTSELDSANQIHEMESASQDRELMSTPVFELEGHRIGSELDVSVAAAKEILVSRSIREAPLSPQERPESGPPLPSPRLDEPLATPASEGLSSINEDDDHGILASRISYVPASSVRSSGFASPRSSGAPLLSPMTSGDLRSSGTVSPEPEDLEAFSGGLASSRAISPMPEEVESGRHNASAHS